MSDKEKHYPYSRKILPHPFFTCFSVTPLALIKRNKELVDALKKLGLEEEVVFNVLCKTYGYKYLLSIKENEFITQGDVREPHRQRIKREYQQVVKAIKAVKTCLNNQEICDDTKELLKRDLRYLGVKKSGIIFHKGIPYFEGDLKYIRKKEQIAFTGKQAKTIIQVKARQIDELYEMIKPLAECIPYGHYTNIRLFDLIGEIFEVTHLYDKYGATLPDNSAGRIEEYYNNNYNEL